MKVFVDKNKVSVKFALFNKTLKLRFKDAAGNETGFLVFIQIYLPLWFYAVFWPFWPILWYITGAKIDS